MHNTQFPTIAKLARMYLWLFLHHPCPFRESVFKSQVDPGASVMEPTSPMAGGNQCINSPEVLCMNASKEIIQ